MTGLVDIFRTAERRSSDRSTNLRTLGPMRALFALLAFAAVYFVAGRFGLSLAFHFPAASPVWPPSGIALAVLIIWGRWLAPAVFVGALLVNITTPGIPVVAAVCIAIGNMLESLVGAELVARYARGRDAFHQPRDIAAAVFLAGICSTAISATIGVTSQISTGAAVWEDFRSFWLTWWLGDAVSVIVITPFLLIWFARPLPRMTSRQLAEACAALVILVLVGLLVFQTLAPGRFRLFHFMTIPPLLWVTYRFRRRGASLANVVLSAIAVAGTVRGLGPFVSNDPNQSLILLQAFIGTVSVTDLVLGGVVAEQLRTEQFLRVQYGISRVLAEASSLPEAAPKILKAVCEAAGWDFGGIWRVDTAEGVLRCVECWHLPKISFPEFERVSRSRAFAKNIGLPGRIWASAEPVWVRDITRDDNFPRGPVANQEGLHGAFGFPILRNNEVLGVIEFFSCEAREPDENFLSMIGVIGSQVGQFIERKESEDALRAAKEQLSNYTNELEERVARRTARLNDTVRSLESFSYSIAHDLRAPVRAMAGFATILKEQYAANLDAEAMGYIGRIVDAAARMDRLIMDLLAYGQMAHMDVPRSDVSLDPVIQEAIEQLANEIAATGATIQVRPGLPAVKAHRPVLIQIFVNLIGNALKFVAAGVKPRVVISAESQDNTVRVRLCDNGIGVDPALYDRIFNVFERGPATSGYPGTGIGLAIAQKGVERLGGRIGIEPAPEGGTCFWIELPAA